MHNAYNPDLAHHTTHRTPPAPRQARQFQRAPPRLRPAVAPRIGDGNVEVIENTARLSACRGDHRLGGLRRFGMAAGEVVQEQVEISAAKLQAGSYAVWMGMYAPVTQMRAAVEAGPGAVVDNRALLLEFQLAP